MQLDGSDGRYAMNYMRNMLFIIVTLSVLIYKYYIYYYLFFNLSLKGNSPQLSSCEKRNPSLEIPPFHSFILFYAPS